MQRRIDEAADAAGRPPAAIRRLLNVPAEVTADDLARMVELGFDTFDAWPREDEEAASGASARRLRLASELVGG